MHGRDDGRPAPMEGLTEFEFWRYSDEQFAEFDEQFP